MTVLNERCVLSCLTVGGWNGKMIDRDVTEGVSEKYHADRFDAGRYSKQLVATKYLKNVSSKISVTRRVHRLLTLPWDDSARILSNTGYLHYTEQMRLQRHAVEAAATAFCEQLPEFIHEAKARLGTMFDQGDYPLAEVLRKKFYVDIEIKPVPTAGDFRAELSDAHVKAITKDIERRTDQRMKAAVDDVFKRIADATSKMVERLRAFKPATVTEEAENTFRDTLVWNIRELAELIPSLNITDDKRLRDLHTALLADCTVHEPQKLRDDAKLRAKTADAAEKILKKVNTFMA
jgi:hypothetical protein